MSKSELSTEPYKGVRDFYPSDWAKLSAAFSIIRGVLSRFGYEEYQASPLEPAELYESKGNEEIVNEQTFTFEDRGGRRVTIRPEMTPTLARMVAGKRRELVFPLRWYSIPNVFRYERPQRGRLREHYQLNVDLLGLPAGEADVEVITIASDVLKAFGAKESDFSIRVNSRALLSAACKATGYTDEEGAREYWRLLDRKAKMSKEEFEEARKGKKDPLSVIEEGVEPGVKKEKESLLATLETLRARGIGNVVFDPEIVRGFDYYTGVVFEVFDTDPSNNRSMFGGGRYDGLVALFGGDPIPAIGFGMGDVTLMDFLETHGHVPESATAPQVYIGTPSEKDSQAAGEFAKRLRDAGIRTFLNLTGKSLGDQIKEADKRGIPLFIAYGGNEAASGMVKIKTLATGNEEEVTVAEAASRITSLPS